MRKLLVKHFVLSTHIRVFGVGFNTLRAPRILFPVTVLVAVIVVGNPLTYDLFWYDYMALAFLFLMYWIGLGNFSFTYFGRWPAKWEELVDKEQKFYFLRAVDLKQAKNPWATRYEFEHLDLEKRVLMETLEVELTVATKGARFWNLKSLLGLVVGILMIVGWYLYNFYTL